MKDPILLLKKYFSNKKLPIVKDNNIFLEEKKFKLDTETNLLLKSNIKLTYSWIDLYLFLKYKTNKTSIKIYIEEINEYRKKGLKIQMISINHQNDIENYFFKNLDKEVNVNINENFNVELKKREDITGNQKLSIENIQVLRLTRLKEKINRTKNSILRDNKDYTYILDLLKSSGATSKNEKKEELKKENKYDLSILESILQNGVIEDGKPIIYISNKFKEGNINMGNIKNLLMSGNYSADYDNFKKYNNRYSLEIPIKINNKIINFEVSDDINYIKKKRKIDDIVAIFISGNKYQFKDSFSIWKEINIAKLFKKIRAYYFVYEDERIDPVIRGWNTKILKISRNERHKDQIVKNDFWEDLTNFVNSKKNKN